MLFSTTNENSAVLEFTFHRFTALLTGDLEKSGEAAVLSQRDGVKADLLKVAHHGSRSGTSNRFLDQAQPRWAVISVGRNNPFGHPSHETLSRLWTHGLRPFLTVNEGAITFETDGRRYLLRSHVNGLLEHGDL
jgi:competence protein ComEC